MGRSLVSDRNSPRANAAGWAALVVSVPVIIIMKLLIWPFERPVKRSPNEVVGFLRGIVDGSGDDAEWDDFVSVPIADPDLERLRLRAAAINGLRDEEHRPLIQELLAEAEVIAAEPRG